LDSDFVGTSILQRYAALTPHQLVAVSPWIVRTFVYQRFTITPRLTLTSPVRGCGKSTLLDLIEALCLRPLKSDSITAAGIYHAVVDAATPLAPPRLRRLRNPGSAPSESGRPAPRSADSRRTPLPASRQ
jgi:hypothetical protein